jgi:thioredoxin 1
MSIKVLKFYSKSCAPCRVLDPIIQDIAQKNSHKATFLSVDVDIQKDLAREKRVSSVPTVIVEKDGVETQRIVGVRARSVYENAIN